MIVENMPHPWRTGVGWLLANTIGCLLGFGLWDFVARELGWLSPAATTGASIAVSAAVYTLGAGLLALCQWLLLGLRVSGWAAWAAVTMLGFGVGDLASRALEDFLTRSAHLSELGGFLLFFALIGIGVGSGQWLLLRRSFPRAGWWIPANAAGWAGGALTFITIVAHVRSDLSLMAFAAALGVVSGVVTGLCLVWLGQAAPTRGLGYGGDAQA